MTTARRSGRRRAHGAAAALGAALVLACAGAEAGAPGVRPERDARPVAAAPVDRFDLVVVDAGHGGEDRGARGSGGLLEKDLVLDVSRRVARRLRAGGVQVVMTRDGDVTVGLEQRTSLANDVRADLFLSIHANAARARGAAGTETYFASLEASDASAQRLAELENSAFGADVPPGALGADPLVALMGDLIATEHMRDAQEFARIAQGRLKEVSLARSRGVKQAPFVVLLGVQMPAALVEIGFLTNPDEEKALRNADRRDRIAEALARAVFEFGRRYDDRRGVSGDERTAGGGR